MTLTTSPAGVLWLCEHERVHTLPGFQGSPGATLSRPSATSSVPLMLAVEHPVCPHTRYSFMYLSN